MDRRTFLARLSALPLATLLPRGAPFQSLLQSQEQGAEPKLSACMWIYLWDILDEGASTVLQRLKEQGLTALSLATSYHAGKILAPHDPKRKVLYLEDGAVYFNPRMHLYGRLKPRVSSLVQGGNGLTKIKKSADDIGLETRAWVVCCHNTPLGMEFPSTVVRNAFGDPLYHALCPSNSDVRTYLATLVRDIATEGVGVIELEAMNFLGYTHGYHHERTGISLTPGAEFLLGLCFCSSCSQRASLARVNVRELQEYTRKTLEKYFEHPESFTESLATSDALPAELFQPFMEWRKKSVAALADELMNGVYPLKTKLIPMVSLDPITQVQEGMDPSKIAEITGGILILGYVKEGSALREPLARLQSLIGQKEMTVGLQVGLPESGGRQEFLDRMQIAREAGISRFNFYNYGLIPLDNLGWIKEALKRG